MVFTYNSHTMKVVQKLPTLEEDQFDQNEKIVIEVYICHIINDSNIIIN